MPIIRFGYRSDDDKNALTRFYASKGWKTVRAVVKARDGNRCRWCGEGPRQGFPLDCVHVSASTLDLIRAGDPLDPAGLAMGHRGCHRRFSAGMLGPPRG